MGLVSEKTVRTLSLDDLDLANLAEAENEASDASKPVDESDLDEDDEVLSAVRRAHEMGYAGVILSGPARDGKKLVRTADWRRSLGKLGRNSFCSVSSELPIRRFCFRLCSERGGGLRASTKGVRTNLQGCLCKP